MHPSSFSIPLKGLYLILEASWASRCSLIDVLKQAGELGVKLVQYRNKQDSMREVYEQAVVLRNMAGELGVKFIVNDRCDLAKAVNADGVHLGQSDLPLEMARNLMGEKCLIGISTHRAEEVQSATMEGADYLGFGPIYPTSTKKNHEPLVGLDGLQHARSLTTLPIFAIGGITAQTVPSLLNAGADGVAVASAILGAADIQSALQQFMVAMK